MAASASGMRTQVHDMIRYFNDIAIVLNDEDGVSSITQLLKKFVQTMHVTWM
ncbi:MAG: hypothetical protein JOZ32_21310 [Bryobacterales bacterium]|nr:hypothetical protein [Bryobacterales bacterium]